MELQPRYRKVDIFIVLLPVLTVLFVIPENKFSIEIQSLDLVEDYEIDGHSTTADADNNGE